jgi:TusA-related sulfurtransferase
MLYRFSDSGIEIAEDADQGTIGDRLDREIKHNLDLRETIHPLALLKAKKAFREMQPGDTLEILIADPDTRTDLYKVLSEDVHELFCQEEVQEDCLFYRIQLAKRIM